MITNAVARRYAKALIELAEEEVAVEKYYDELRAFEAVIAENAEALAFFSTPSFTLQTKKELLKEIIAASSFSPTVASFILLLLEENRLGEISPVVRAYRSFADELSGFIRGRVTSALPLAEVQVDEIREALEKSTGKKVLLQVDVDPSLIGGIVTRIGDKIFDGSIKTQLTRISEILQKG